MQVQKNSTLVTLNSFRFPVVSRIKLSQVRINVSNVDLRLLTTSLTGFLSRNNLKTSLKLLKNFCNISNKDFFSEDNPSCGKICNPLITIYH